MRGAGDSLHKFLQLYSTIELITFQSSLGIWIVKKTCKKPVTDYTSVQDSSVLDGRYVNKC